MIDPSRQKSKPTGQQTGYIVNRLRTTDITLPELADALVHGASFRPGILVGGRKQSNWTEQQVFALDIDHGVTIQEAYVKSVSLGLTPCFMYTSFSHTEEEHRFRIIYCAEEVITEGTKRDRLQIALMNSLGVCDPHCTDRNRVFFGGCGGEALYPHYDARINADDVISRFWSEEDEKALSSKKKAVVSIRPKSKAVAENANVNTHVPLIKQLDAEGLRKQLSWDFYHTGKEDIYLKKNNIFTISMEKNPPELKPEDDVHQFNSLAEMYEFFERIDLHDYLGVPDGMFRCILPEHDDSTPSAHIYTTDDGTQIYKCFGCGQARTITTITEQIAHCSRKAAIDFLKAVYRVNYTPSEWVIQQQTEIIEAATYLDSMAFRTTYPEINRILGRRKGDLIRILIHMTQYLNDQMQFNGRPIFFMSLSRLMNICETNDRNRMDTSMALLALLGMMDKLDLSCIPEDRLARAKEISEANGFGKLVTFYGVPSYDYLSLREREIQAKVLRDHHFSLKGMSREYVYRTFGEDEANRVYPQYTLENSWGMSKTSNDRTLTLEQLIMDEVQRNGYALERSFNTNDLMGRQYKR